MKCVDVKENLDALLDGEIEFAFRRKIESHLETCVFCQSEFNRLRAVGEALKQNSAIFPAPSLDEKVFSAFASFHAERNSEKTTRRTPEKSPKEKTGWFGIPRFAYAAVFALFALATIAAFQLGRMSAANGELAKIEFTTGAQSPVAAAATGDAEENALEDDVPPIQTVAVPVIREKIIKIPVVREKIIVRTACENPNPENMQSDDRPVLKNAENQSSAVKSRLRDNQYSTQLNLEGFQSVAELKPVIIKGENNEK